MRARLCLATLAAGACFAALPAVAQQAPLEAISGDLVETPRTSGISLYGQIEQSLDLDDLVEGDFRTFTIVTGGVDAFVNRERLQGSISYSASARVYEAGNGDDRFDNNLLARGSAEAIRDFLFIDGSAFAGLLTNDAGRGVSFNPALEDDNLNQTYAFTVGPRVERRIGNFAQFSGSYSFSYVDVDDNFDTGGGAGGAGIPGYSSYSDSITHTAQGSITGFPRGRLTWAVTGSFVNNQQEDLEQRFESRAGTLQLGYGISREFRLVGDVGYESYNSTRQAVLQGPRYLRSPFSVSPDIGNPDIYIVPGSNPAELVALPGGPFTVQGPPPAVGFLPDPVNFLINPVFATSQLSDPLLILINGDPIQVAFGDVVGLDGQFIPDPTGARTTLYQDSGLVWNAGFRWNPSPRTLLEARAGSRFGDLVITGLLRYEVSRNVTVFGSLTDGIQNFGTIVTQVIDGVPFSFVEGGRNNQGSLGGCVIGIDPSDPTFCIDGQTQSITSGVFRSKIGQLGVRGIYARSDWLINFSYNQREYLDEGATLDPNAPIIDPTLADRFDRTLRLTARYDRELRPGEEISFSVFGAWADLALRPDQETYTIGGRVAYNRRLAEKLDAFAAVFMRQLWDVDATTENFNSVLSFGLRYTF